MGVSHNERFTATTKYSTKLVFFEKVVRGEYYDFYEIREGKSARTTNANKQNKNKSEINLRFFIEIKGKQINLKRSRGKVPI